MYKFTIIWTAALFTPFFMLASSQVRAVGHPYEFHADAKMQILDQGPVDKAYGYMNLFTDNQGDGVINVMFSNASDLDRTQFNARVKFLSATGTVIREENFNCWLDSAEIEEPIECKVSKALTLSDFESIKVDFYLSEAP